MNVALTPQQLRKILAAATEKDLKKELADRVVAQKKGECDHCYRPLMSEPYCAIPYRHEGRKPEDWEGLCDTPRISKDRWSMAYWRDDGGYVSMSRFPGLRWHLDIRVHLPCDGDGCDDRFCESGFVHKHLDFGDDFKLKWPEDVIDFGSGFGSGSGGPTKRSRMGPQKKPHA